MDYTLNTTIPLLPTQQEGIEFMLSRSGAIIDFQTGLGKTYLSLTAALHLLLKYPTAFLIIICPANANKAFRKELKALSLIYSMYTTQETREVKGARVAIFNYSSLKDHLERIQALSAKYKIISIVDEGHRLGNRYTAQAKQVFELSKHFKLRYVLTATPLTTVNNIQALYWICEYVRPGFLAPNLKTFQKWFLVIDRKMIKIHRKGKIGDDAEDEIPHEVIVGIKNQEALRKKLSEVLIERHIPYNLFFHYHATDITQEEASFYRRAGRGIINEGKKKAFVARLHDLAKVVNNSHPSIPERMKRLLSSKEKLLIRTLYEQVLSKEMSGIIVCEHYDTVNRLYYVLEKLREKVGISKVYKITGSVSADARDKIEDDIQPCSVIIMTRAGSESRNLQKANQVLFYDTPFSIGVTIQSVGRVARCDSIYTEQHIHFIEARGTIDTYKRILIQDSAHYVKEFFGESPNLPDIKQIDRKILTNIRRKLLWSFSAKTSA